MGFSQSLLLVPSFFAVSLLSQQAMAAMVTITNPSFESDPVAPGTYAVGNAGWTAGSFGRFRGGGDFGEGANPTDGLQIAFLSPQNYAYQDLASTYAAATDYTLSVDVAVRDSDPSNTSSFTLVLYQINPFNVVQSLGVAYNTLAVDQFTTLTVTATAADVLAAGAVGQPIGIRFSNGSPNGAKDFDLDNVTLFSMVPEPASLSLLALGGLALLRRRSR